VSTKQPEGKQGTSNRTLNQTLNRAFDIAAAGRYFLEKAASSKFASGHEAFDVVTPLNTQSNSVISKDFLPRGKFHFYNKVIFQPILSFHFYSRTIWTDILFFLQ